MHHFVDYSKPKTLFTANILYHATTDENPLPSGLPKTYSERSEKTEGF
jgi:hypothetical protein